MRDQDTEWGLTLNRSASCGITDKRSRSTLRPSLAMSTPSISIFPLLISTMRNSVSIMEDFPAPVLRSAPIISEPPPAGRLQTYLPTTPTFSPARIEIERL